MTSKIESQLSTNRIDSAMANILAQKTESERLQIAWSMWSSARRMMQRVIHAEQSDWTADQIEMEVSKRMSNGT